VFWGHVPVNGCFYGHVREKVRVYCFWGAKVRGLICSIFTPQRCDANQGNQLPGRINFPSFGCAHHVGAP